LNRWRAFVAGQVAARPSADAPRVAPSEFESRGRSRAHGRNDEIAWRKRVAKRRAKKGYK
jgi:hypothetical protein